MARNRYLRRGEFRDYLLDFIEENGEDAQLGVPRVTNLCPLSKYLEKLTNREWNVSPLACVPQVRTEAGEDQFHLRHEFRPPRWAKDYIYALDALNHEPVAVTAREALYVLDEAVK